MDLGKKPQLGEIILRPVVIVNTGTIAKPVYNKQIAHFNVETSRKGCPMFCAQRHQELNGRYVANDTGEGMRCFSTDEVKPDWSHFIITRVGKDSRSVNVDPQYHDMQELFDAWPGVPSTEDEMQASVTQFIKALNVNPALLPAKELANLLIEEDIRSIWAAKLEEDIADWNINTCLEHTGNVKDLAAQFISSCKTCEGILEHLWGYYQHDSLYKVLQKARNLRSDFTGILAKETLA